MNNVKEVNEVNQRVIQEYWKIQNKTPYPDGISYITPQYDPETNLVTVKLTPEQYERVATDLLVFSKRKVECSIRSLNSYHKKRQNKNTDVTKHSNKKSWSKYVIITDIKNLPSS